MKFRTLSVLLGVLLLRLCAANAEQFVESGSGGHVGITDAEAARTIKISVTQHGEMIKVNGEKTTLDGLERDLKEFAAQRREICYYKDWPKIRPSNEEPSTTAILIYVDLKLDPVSTKVLKVAADYHLPVFFSKNAECSEGVVREVQNFRELVLSSPAPNCSSEAKESPLPDWFEPKARIELTVVMFSAAS
jgi:hypothetical protein